MGWLLQILWMEIGLPPPDSDDNGTDNLEENKIKFLTEVLTHN